MSELPDDLEKAIKKEPGRLDLLKAKLEKPYRDLVKALRRDPLLHPRPFYPKPHGPSTAKQGFVVDSPGKSKYPVELPFSIRLDAWRLDGPGRPKKPHVEAARQQLADLNVPVTTAQALLTAASLL